MLDVAEFTFEELGFEIRGVLCGMFSGTAHIDSDGAITAIDLDGYRNGKPDVAKIDVPVRTPLQNYHTSLADQLANALYSQKQDAINAALEAWQETRHIREHDYEFA